jgi:hypothetical protein
MLVMDLIKAITAAALESCRATWGALCSTPLLVLFLCGTLLALVREVCWLLWRVLNFAPRLVQIASGVVFLPFAVIADFLCDHCTYAVPGLRCLDHYRTPLALVLLCSAGLLAANKAHYSVGLCVCENTLRPGVDPGVLFVDIYSSDAYELAIIVAEATRLAASATFQLASILAGAAARLAR